ncbi:glycosyl hydrolase family 2 [Larkinella arboricola]|uniref:beta-galactosidase n=1 Tax=Larkinella arboricola TaxID=643671 RepID=A0A327XDF6_LARAB|nr:sugar-binding domain-containing protein [Larkinella arboricola]RAK02296.1 glycosyl hydrolase family 2 [Larkinella arboricola]
MQKKWLGICLFALAIGFAFSNRAIGQNKLSLAGEWQLRLDPNDLGLRQHWWQMEYTDRVTLPGSLAENGKGNDITLQTPWTGDVFDSTYFVSERYQKYRQGDVKIPFWLKPVKYYTGPAWYKRQIDIPADWAKKQITLNLERCHWETMVYVNGQFCGTRNSLVAPHQFDLSKALRPGRNTIVVRVDNRYKMHIGPNSHSVADHTQTNWNGLVGDLSLTAGSTTYLDDVQVYPKLATKTIAVTLDLHQPRRQTFRGKIILQAKPVQPNATALPNQEQPVNFSTEETTVTATYAIPNPQLWDEFTPNRYELRAQLVSEQGEVLSEKTVPFGMREMGTSGTRLTINGRPIFLRGDVDCAAFPLTGYPPTTEPYWEKIMKTAKAYGLNHLRFHSWCPPEAAFDVADRLGMYLYVESPLWANQSSAVGTGGVIDDFIYRESERILKAYGNHPSFCMMSYGNEPGGAFQSDFLGRWVEHFKQKDGRRLYTSGAGWPMLPENQFHIHSDARIQQWGQGVNSIINAKPPQTGYDWREIIQKASAPYISHEIGQWCVYPNFGEMAKYKGVLKPTNFEIFKETLEEAGMGDQAEAFLHSSGRLQTLCYKADIEAALRTPGFAGFQLLGLHDFPGQGTALVGALDVFWESKGYTTPEEYRTFCNNTVLLARLDKLVYENNETLQAALEIAHFGPQELTNQTVIWQVLDASGKVKRSGTLQKDRVAIDNGQTVGTVHLPLAGFKKPEMLTLKVALKGTDVTNTWNFWVYPTGVNPDAARGKVIVAHSLTDDVVNQLQNGANVLLLSYGHVRKGKGAEVEIGFSSVFWNTSWTKGQAPHTLGLLCDPAHPLFAAFPTEASSNYQWQDLVSHSQTVILNDFPKTLRPLIQPIDTWFENRRLSLAFEGRVGKGNLLVCSIDLDNNLAQRSAARQLKYSLLNYMNSSRFKPGHELSADQISQLFQQETTLISPAQKK